MPRFQMDDSLYDDPAVIRVGTAAFGLYARCGDYVARQLLDGFVPSEIAAQWGTPEWARKLTDAGLWKTVPGGHYMPRYLVDNPSRDKVLAERKAKAQRQQRWLEKKRKGRSGQRRTNRPSRDASQDVSIDAPEDVAQPTSFTGSKGRARANGASAAHASTPWCGNCDKRTRQTGDPPRRCPLCHPLADNPEARVWRATHQEGTTHVT